MNRFKKININCNINKLYIFIEKIKLIELINPNNILIMYLFNIKKDFLIIRKNELYCSIDNIINKLNINQMNDITKQILIGIDNLHKLNIIHNNIKNSNILFNENYDLFFDDYCINSLKYNKNEFFENDYYDIIDIINSIYKLNIKNINEKYQLHYNINKMKYNYEIIKENKNINDILLIISNKIKISNIYVIDKLLYYYNISYDSSKYYFILIQYIWDNFSSELRDYVKTRITKKTIIKNIFMKKIYIDKDIINNLEKDKINLECILYYIKVKEISYTGINYIFNNICFIDKMKILNLCGNLIDNNEMKIIVQRLNHIPNLTEINFNSIYL